jgi:hypothetical protein
MEYMNARARHFGYRSYADERAAKINPFFTIAFERARNQGQSRNQALETAARIVGPSRIVRASKTHYAGSPEGREMSRVIQRMYADGLYDYGDDVDESEFYE